MSCHIVTRTRKVPVKRKAFFYIMLIAFSIAAYSQASISEDISAFYAFGIAEPDQAISGIVGTYEFLKNGFYVDTNITAKINVAYVYDIAIKLKARKRVGSPYGELQLTFAAPQDFGVSLDSAYGKIDVLNGLKLDSPVDLFLTAGKFEVKASNFQKVSLYGIESALNMLKLKTDLNLGAEAAITFSTREQLFETTYSDLVLQVITGGLLDESIERLYDTDGSMSSHGLPVIGEYDWRLFSSLKLSNYVLPFGVFSAEGIYTYNGAGIYSGHSFGASTLLDITIIPELLSIPVGAGFAFYDKNIDTLAGEVWADFRNTIRAGAGLGARFDIPFTVSAALNFGGSFTYINHIYREPISIFGLCVDGKCTAFDSFFIGAGVVLGTLTDVVWQTRSDVSSMYDDYRHTFTLPQNLGFEAYTGINIGTKCSITMGVNNNKGLSMNYALESVKDGEYKYRQKDTAAADGLYETFSVYLKTTLKM